MAGSTPLILPSCSSGQYIRRKWTDRLKKRTERHQWSIVCSQDAPSNSSGSQYCISKKPKYIAPSALICFTNFTSSVSLWLHKSIKSTFLNWEVCVRLQHLPLPPKVWNLSNSPLPIAFQTVQVKYITPVLLNELCYSFKARSLYSTLSTTVCIHTHTHCSRALWPSCISSALQIMTDIKWMLRSWSAITDENYFLPWHRSEWKSLPCDTECGSSMRGIVCLHTIM